MNIKERRNKLGLSQAELGKLCGCTAAYISMLENGHYIATEHTMARIRQALGGPKAPDKPLLVPFKDQDEAKEMNRIWEERQGY